MSIEKLIEELNKIAKNAYDEESDHSQADKLLLEFINNEEVTKAFNSIDKWYA